MVRRGLLRCEYQYPHSTTTKICKDISRAARDRNRAKNKATHVQGSLLSRSHSAHHRGSLPSSHTPLPVPLSIPIPALPLAPSLYSPFRPPSPTSCISTQTALRSLAMLRKDCSLLCCSCTTQNDSYFNNKF